MGSPFGFVYLSEFSGSGQAYEVTTNVSFFTESIQETVSPAPEPRYGVLLILSLASTFAIARRRLA